jgi:uncharacterized membrane protein YcaP (DUF421 family)
MKSVRLRRLLCGKPVILIEDGKILQNNLRRTRVTLDELTAQLREKDVLELDTVQYAILETNGNLSVFPYPKEVAASAREAGVKVKDRYLPVTVIADGRLYAENFVAAGVDSAWVQRTLKKRETTVANTWLLTVDRAGKVTWIPKEAGE